MLLYEIFWADLNTECQQMILSRMANKYSELNPDKVVGFAIIRDDIQDMLLDSDQPIAVIDLEELI